MVSNCQSLIDKLESSNHLDLNEFTYLIENRSQETLNYLKSKSYKIKEKYYGNKIYIRGLIEISNICKNNCLYCGIRKDNLNLTRYRLSKDDILSCCKEGYKLGFRTFVMQGGEDLYFTDDKMCSIIDSIKNLYPDCAVTLSLGEKSRKTYEAYFNAGADRYLLRHETSNEEHYKKLHPAFMSLKNRKECLFNLKDIGYQTGTGFMVGSPYQTSENLAEDMIFIKKLNPEMIGIGPFIHHCDTPFRNMKDGGYELTLFMIGLLRLMIPNALIPATTALGTIKKEGREQGILMGANVVMPNLSPISKRKLYTLYDNKIAFGAESAQHLDLLRQKLACINQEIEISRGDFINC